ncbi:MAG: type VI secretion system accessory protein TagJ, partial [Verrucomicrobiota bacterium]
PGAIGEESFEWLADADPRIGPVLEFFMANTYYWVPFCRIRSMKLFPPTELRDLLWSGVALQLINGGKLNGFIPVRYPGSESHEDGLVRLGRKTIWRERDQGYFDGLGQRMLTGEERQWPLLELSAVEFDVQEAEDEMAPVGEEPSQGEDVGL